MYVCVSVCIWSPHFASLVSSIETPSFRLLDRDQVVDEEDNMDEEEDGFLKAFKVQFFILAVSYLVIIG